MLTIIVFMLSFITERILLSRAGGGTGPLKPSNLLSLQHYLVYHAAHGQRFCDSEGANLMQGIGP